MSWFPPIFTVALLCMGFAHGLLKRQPWAWYAGWGFLAMTGLAVASFALTMALQVENLRQANCLVFFIVGVMVLLRLFASRWSAWRDEFNFPKPVAPPAEPSSPAPPTTNN